jgi:hypothetical protein
MVKFSSKLTPYMTQAAQADLVATAPKHPTPVKDMLFPASSVVQKNGAFITTSEIEDVTGAVPVSTRGSRSYPVDGNGTNNKLIEVNPVNPSMFIPAADINNLIQLGQTANIQALVNEKTLQLRNIISDTIELMARQSLGGKISYPLYNGSEITGTYDVDLGSIKGNGSVSLTGFDLAKLFNFLADLRMKQAATGAATQVGYLVGTKVYQKIVSIMTQAGSNAPVVYNDKGAKLFGAFDILAMPYDYVLPGKPNDVKHVIDENVIQTIDMANTGKLFYAAVDDLDANLQPLPFFVKAHDVADPDGVKLIAQSKPLPAAALRYMTKTTCTGL